MIVCLHPAACPEYTVPVTRSQAGTATLVTRAATGALLAVEHPLPAGQVALSVFVEGVERLRILYTGHRNESRTS